MQRPLRNFGLGLLLIPVIVLASLSFSLDPRNKYIVPPAALKSAPYAEWAHYHWSVSSTWLSDVLD